MTSYQTVVQNDTTDDTGTRTLDVKAGFVGDRTDNAPTGRMPAFIGLARHTGGAYVENTAGLTVDDALTKAGLDFTVALHPFEAVVGDARLPGPDRLRTVVG